MFETPIIIARSFLNVFLGGGSTPMNTSSSKIPPPYYRLLIFCFFAFAFFITRSFHDPFFGSTPTNTSTMTTAKRRHLFRLLLFFCSFSVPSFHYYNIITNQFQHVKLCSCQHIKLYAPVVPPTTTLFLSCIYT